MAVTTGIRERKKAQTRRAIMKAVMHLALERGLDAVTADDIAAAADISVRTFHNYFGSKEEALISAWRSEFAVHLEELRARPPEEPILVSLEHVFAGIAERIAVHPTDTSSRSDLLWTSTFMASRRSLLLDEAVRMLTDIVAERTGTDAATDGYPHLVTATAISATASAFLFASTCPPGECDAERLIHENFALLRAGLVRTQPGP
ncbi:MAG: TetR/AcrR family transcriptional regulator [Actinobacteria bacterium]|nr:TetR/AcrR family transcriptional regulator [Actinomycetota bacterium]